jgi:hypothetical protein
MGHIRFKKEGRDHYFAKLHQRPPLRCAVTGTHCVKYDFLDIPDLYHDCFEICDTAEFLEKILQSDFR